jgi:hypothetical protein
LLLALAVAVGAACGAHRSSTGAKEPTMRAPMYGGGDAYGGMGYAYGNGKGW